MFTTLSIWECNRLTDWLASRWIQRETLGRMPSMNYANPSQPLPIVGPYGPKWLTNTKNNHHSYVSDILVRPSGGHLTLVWSSERDVVCWASQFQFPDLLLLQFLADPLGINTTNKVCSDDFYRIGPESALRHLESIAFALTSKLIYYVTHNTENLSI